MSNNIFPTFQGISFTKTIYPVQSTTIYTSPSGVETRRQNYSYPLYKIELNYNFMSDNSTPTMLLIKGDLEKLLGFYNKQGGSFDDFLYLDDKDNCCTNQAFDVADGVKTQFRLQRSLPDYIEPICGIVNKPIIMINGVVTTAFTFDNNGNIYFTSPPPKDAILTWSGQYLFRVRFEEDNIELQRTWQGLWENITVKLITVKV